MENGKAYLSREAVLAAQDIETADVSVPEWGGLIRLKMMTASEREQYEADLIAMRDAGQTANIRASLVAACAVDPATGQRLFANVSEVARLSEKSATVIVRLFDKARELNLMLQDEAENIKKNSEPRPSADSHSA